MKQLFAILPLFIASFAAPLTAADAPAQPSLDTSATMLNTLTSAEKDAGWKLLFDGKDANISLRGYNKPAMPDGWVVENGALIRRGKGDVITKDQFESFELSIDWKITAGANSGIMFKVQETKQAPYMTGPEAQIIDNSNSGHEPQKAGWMYGLYPATVDTTKPVGEWNTFVIKCQKTPAGTFKCEHIMNGTSYVTYEIGSPDWAEKVAKSKFAKWPDFGKSDKGHICLQDHGNEVAFRNIKIRELK